MIGAGIFNLFELLLFVEETEESGDKVEAGILVAVGRYIGIAVCDGSEGVSVIISGRGASVTSISKVAVSVDPNSRIWGTWAVGLGR